MKFAEKYFHTVVIAVCASFLSSLSFASEQESTWQIKCQQKDNGREVVCWMVEVPSIEVEEED